MSISPLSFGYSQNLQKQMLEQKNNKQKQDLIRKSHDQIYAHEMAHKIAGGALAGGIVLNKNAQGVTTSGFVPIKMPSLDPNNLDKTISDAKTVQRAALAPSDPSDQDYNVAFQAKLIESKAVSSKMKKAHGKNDKANSLDIIG